MKDEKKRMKNEILQFVKQEDNLLQDNILNWGISKIKKSKQEEQKKNKIELKKLKNEFFTFIMNWKDSTFWQFETKEELNKIWENR